jgi:hypothetical protein
MTNSHSSPIDHSRKSGYFEIFSVQPEVSIDVEGKSEMTNWIVDKTFILNVTVTDIVRMKGFYIEVEWGDCLETNYQSVEVTQFLPPPYELYTIGVNSTGLTVLVKVPAEESAINGTGTILRVTFKAKNPWGDIPPYHSINGEYLPENRTCKIQIKGGWIDVYCPEYRKMEFYNSSYGVQVGKDFSYAFTPVPGDLNLDGQVDAVDLSAISKWVGFDQEDPEWSECSGFDLNSDGRVDVFDVVIVANNFGRIHP